MDTHLLTKGQFCAACGDVLGPIYLIPLTLGTGMGEMDHPSVMTISCQFTGWGTYHCVFHWTVSCFGLWQNISPSPLSRGISCCKYLRNYSGNQGGISFRTAVLLFLPLLCWVNCLQTEIPKSSITKRIFFYWDLGIWELFYHAAGCYSRSWTARIMQRYRRVKLVEGRGRWNLHCHPGLLILSAHFRQLLSSESFLSHCQELLWIFLRCMRITGCKLSRLNSVQWPVLCHVRGFNPAGACPDPWRSLSAISISIYWQYQRAEFYYKTWSCLTWLRGWYRPAWLRAGRDSTSARVGGWLLGTGRICSTAQGTRDLLTWCSLQFLHSCQVLQDGNLAEEALFKSGCSVSLSIINYNLPLSFS